jgi:hypothetical protein
VAASRAKVELLTAHENLEHMRLLQTEFEFSTWLAPEF